MSKLRNGVEYTNEFFKPEFGDYLILSGMIASNESKETLKFQKGNTCMYVRNDTIDVFRFIPEEPETSQKWKFFESYTGVAHKSVFQFMMLMQAMNVVLLNDFRDLAIFDQCAQLVQESNTILRGLMAELSIPKTLMP